MRQRTTSKRNGTKASKTTLFTFTHEPRLGSFVKRKYKQVFDRMDYYFISNRKKETEVHFESSSLCDGHLTKKKGLAKFRFHFLNFHCGNHDEFSQQVFISME